VLGIDPAHGPAKVAMQRGIPTVKDFFSADLARHLPQADIIHANNVLAHVPDLNDFVAGLAIMLKPSGTCYIEVPYLGSLIDRCEFDTIYHEHAYYFSYKSLATLFERHGLFIKWVYELDAHGGSLRLRIGKRKHAFFAGLLENFNYDTLQSRMERIASNLNEILYNLQRDGKRVWGFGAAAKATVMMNYCGITHDLIEAVADNTPAKIEKYIPGTGVRIVLTRDWPIAQPDYTCIFAWNYALLIMERYAPFYRGTFFTPYNLPKEAACSTSASAS